MLVRASAPAKLILCGEHAVVYGQPAIALPLHDICATATVQTGPPGSGAVLFTPDLGPTPISTPDDPLLALAATTLHLLGSYSAAVEMPDLHITLTSAIPIASGMGSGAAVATALVRALAAYGGHPLSAAQVSELVYQSEQRYHGTPSGIDNAVIAYEQAIWFVRQLPAPRIEPIHISAPLHLVVGDTGVRSATRLPVGEVRRRWQTEAATYEALFAEVGAVVAQVRAGLQAGDTAQLGQLLNHNQRLLEQLGVSSPELERLVAAARAAGAAGAKLSGGGWGGVMVALAPDEGTQAIIAAALERAGAAQVLSTRAA
ncbi:MAG: mevalonate kinase [Chloroflexaceae bacterium]|nr:mevalonate kinase [Chloroflexaceae bacterium]NJO08231.1 mevalonate kinase [Chloroflexaceae bacterium]